MMTRTGMKQENAFPILVVPLKWKTTFQNTTMISCKPWQVCLMLGAMKLFWLRIRIPAPHTIRAGIAGNVLEWYDFAVFGFFSDIIGETFFPPQAGHSQTVESFAVFGLAFLARPFGGVVMGYIGDVYGRKKALVISIFMMAFPTFAMGCLPSYERVGPVAIVLLMVTRLLQGLSVGGQLMSSLVYTLEKRDPSVWGLYGSFVMA